MANLWLLVRVKFCIFKWEHFFILFLKKRNFDLTAVGTVPNNEVACNARKIFCLCLTWICRSRVQAGPSEPTKTQKEKKREEVYYWYYRHCFDVMDVFFLRAGGFSFSLDVLPVYLTIFPISIAIKILDPDML